MKTSPSMRKFALSLSLAVPLLALGGCDRRSETPVSPSSPSTAPTPSTTPAPMTPASAASR